MVKYPLFMNGQGMYMRKCCSYPEQVINEKIEFAG